MGLFGREKMKELSADDLKTLTTEWRELYGVAVDERDRPQLFNEGPKLVARIALLGVVKHLVESDRRISSTNK